MRLQVSFEQPERRVQRRRAQDVQVRGIAQPGPVCQVGSHGLWPHASRVGSGTGVVPSVGSKSVVASGMVVLLPESALLAQRPPGTAPLAGKPTHGCGTLPGRAVFDESHNHPAISARRLVIEAVYHV